MTNYEIVTRLTAELVKKFEFSDHLDVTEAKIIAVAYSEILKQLGTNSPIDDEYKSAATELTSAYISRDIITFSRSGRDLQAELVQQAEHDVGFYIQVLKGIES